MSLAMCGECKDISKAIITRHHPNGTGGFGYGDLPSVQYLLPPPEYPLNDEVGLSANISIYTDGNAHKIGTWLASQSSTPFVSSFNIAAFDAIMFRNCSCIGDEEYALSCTCEPFAASCAIFPCVKTYRAEIQNFVLNETELSTESFQNHESGYTMWTKKILRHGKWFTCSNSTQPSSENNVPQFINSTVSNITGMETDVYAYTQQGCVWNFALETKFALGNYIASNVWYGGLDGSINLNSPAAAHGNPWLEVMFNSGTATLRTLQAYINGLANTLTAVVRKYGDASEATVVAGTTYRAETCIVVQWAWLSLPATLLLLAIIFLTVTIWRMETRQVVLWKSSPLALLFHGVDREFKGQYGALRRFET